MSNAYRRSADGIAGQHSARIDSLFSQWDQDRSPGAVVAVISKGSVVHQRGYGVANVEDDIAFTGATVLRLGSTSKHLCATCILILQSRGKLRLSDDIRNYVPEMRDYGAVITLQHLLTMTSGLWDGLNVLLFSGLDTSSKVTRQQMLRIISCQRQLMYSPGDDCQYSNSNYALLSLVIERVSGKSLADFMQDELFAPLGMKNSALTPSDTRVSRNKARGYLPTVNGQLEYGVMHVELCGDGGVDSTIADMTRWFLNYRDDTLFGPGYRSQLEAENRLNDGRLVDYRLGINVGANRGQRTVRHAGGMPGYLCDFLFFPDSDLGIIMLANLSSRNLLEMPNKVADIVLEGQLSEPLQSTFTSENDPEAASLRGVFASSEHGLIVEFVVEDEQLVLYLLGDAMPIVSIGKYRFAPADRSVIIELPDDAKVTNDGRPTINLVSGCQPAVQLKPVSDPRNRSEPEIADMSWFAGDYFSDELKETHAVSEHGDELRVNIPSPARSLVWSSLVPVAGDLFAAIVDGEPSCTNVAVKFVRDDNGACTHLSYSISRCRDVLFRKLA